MKSSDPSDPIYPSFPVFHQTKQLCSSTQSIFQKTPPAVKIRPTVEEEKRSILSMLKRQKTKPDQKPILPMNGKTEPQEDESREDMELMDLKVDDTNKVRTF